MSELQPQPRSFPVIRSNRPLTWLVVLLVALAIGATAIDSVIEAEQQTAAAGLSAG